jgi:hypothetical protein
VLTDTNLFRAPRANLKHQRMQHWSSSISAILCSQNLVSVFHLLTCRTLRFVSVVCNKRLFAFEINIRGDYQCVYRLFNSQNRLGRCVLDEVVTETTISVLYIFTSLYSDIAVSLLNIWLLSIVLLCCSLLFMVGLNDWGSIADAFCVRVCFGLIDSRRNWFIRRGNTGMG